MTQRPITYYAEGFKALSTKLTVESHAGFLRGFCMAGSQIGYLCGLILLGDAPTILFSRWLLSIPIYRQWRNFFLTSACGITIYLNLFCNYSAQFKEKPYLAHLERKGV